MEKDKIKSFLPKHRQELIKWNGWGYKDSCFKTQDGQIFFTGNRYDIGNGNCMPNFADCIRNEIGLNLDNVAESVSQPTIDDYPTADICQEFISDLNDNQISFSQDIAERLLRSHGHCMREIFRLRFHRIPRIVDIVIWIECHDQAQKVVELCAHYKYVIIPFGGGTNVSAALECPRNESRIIVSLDTSQMSAIIHLDEVNLTLTCESGIIGQDLESYLNARGFTCGHEPDSVEFSSLGGWISTRASGMKKSTYGNIEDILIDAKMVTPSGVLQKNSSAPRFSAGPDINNGVILGSEGTMGVITEATIRICELPKCSSFGCVMFPDLATGIKFLRKLVRERAVPSSVRLLDNHQFRLGHAMKVTDVDCGDSSWFDRIRTKLGWLQELLKKSYLTYWHGYCLNSVCVATLLFEGSHELVDFQKKIVNRISKEHAGVDIGEDHGKYGYMFTFVIGYLRDFGLTHHFIAESFETSVPWDRCLALCNCVKYKIKTECREHGIENSFVSCRVTQTYHVGAVVYFYFAFDFTSVTDPIHIYEQIEEKARDEIIRCGGSVSHHHGVGKLRQKWMPEHISSTGLNILRAIKSHLDPDNVFNSQNLIYQLEYEAS